MIVSWPAASWISFIDARAIASHQQVLVHNQRHALETRNEIEVAYRGDCLESGPAGSNHKLASGLRNADGEDTRLLHAVRGARDHKQYQAGSRQR
ncbi:MAG TPA: hypothetical protein VND66_07115 [Acidobacteriaceae bacterium]|nr:hypothetical protein [Acidobacteriaceae bacterium]